jgi:hypothetical protein
MCGRYSITTNFEAIRRIFGTAGGGNWWRPRYNVAPTQLAPVVRMRVGQRELVELRWGLIPFWAKDVKVGYKTINLARRHSDRRPLPLRTAMTMLFPWKHDAMGMGVASDPHASMSGSAPSALPAICPTE